MPTTVKARVTQYSEIRLIVPYVTLLIAVLAIGGWASIRALTETTHRIPWWIFDIPWMLLSILGVVPTIQRLLHRGRYLEAELDMGKSVCNISETPFSGEWNIRKKYPKETRQHTMAYVFSIVGSSGIGFSGCECVSRLASCARHTACKLVLAKNNGHSAVVFECLAAGIAACLLVLPQIPHDPFIKARWTLLGTSVCQRRVDSCCCSNPDRRLF